MIPKSIPKLTIFTPKGVLDKVSDNFLACFLALFNDLHYFRCSSGALEASQTDFGAPGELPDRFWRLWEPSRVDFANDFGVLFAGICRELAGQNPSVTGAPSPGFYGERRSREAA